IRPVELPRSDIEVAERDLKSSCGFALFGDVMADARDERTPAVGVDVQARRLQQRHARTVGREEGELTDPGAVAAQRRPRLAPQRPLRRCAEPEVLRQGPKIRAVRYPEEGTDRLVRVHEA